MRRGAVLAVRANGVSFGVWIALLGLGVPLLGQTAVDRSSSEVGITQSQDHSIASPTATNPAQEAEPTAAEVEVTYTINAEGNEKDLVESIQKLASIVNVSVVIDETIVGKLTGCVKAHSFDQALELILPSHNLYYAKHDGKYYIGAADPKSPLFQFISSHEQYVAEYRAAEDLIELLPERLQMFAKKNESSDRILIHAPKSMIEEIKSCLREIDVKVPLVKLTAIACFIAPGEESENPSHVNQTVNVSGQSSFDFGGVVPSFSGLASSDFKVTSKVIRLLQHRGYLTARELPDVFPRTGEPATISVSSERPFFFGQNTQNISEGLDLNITPTICGDTIALDVRVEMHQEVPSKAMLHGAPWNDYPVINRRVIETKGSVRPGGMLVIGGLTKKEVTERTDSKVGLLDTLLLSSHFGTTEKQEKDIEVVILISPSLVKE